MKPESRSTRLLPIAGLLLAALLTLFVGPREASAQSNTTAEADALNSQGITLYQEARYSEAEALWKRALEIREKALGPEHVNVARSLYNLAVLYSDQDRLTEAEPLHKRALAIREKALGPRHNEIAHSLNDLAELYRVQRLFGLAELLHRRALAMREEIWGREHTNVAKSLVNIALLHEDQGHHADVEPIYKRALAIFDKAPWSEHADVAKCLQNFGSFYTRQGRLVEAESLLRRGLDTSEKAFGSEHPEVGISLNSLAFLYLLMGRLAEAQPLIFRALAIGAKAQAPRFNSNFAWSVDSIAYVLRYGGRLAEAEQLYRRALAMREALGPEQIDVATSLDNLGSILRQQGRRAEAEPLHLRALAIREKALSPDDPTVAWSLHFLAILYNAQGRLVEAELSARRALAIREKRLGPEHAQTDHSRAILAHVLFQQGRDGDARTAMRLVAAASRARSALTNDRATERRGEETRFSDDYLMLLAALAERQRTATERITLLSEAFEAAQLVGTRSMSAAVERMATRHASGSDKLAGVVRQRQDAIALRLELNRTLLASIAKLPEHRNTEQEQRLRSDLGEIDKRLDSLDAMLARDFPRYVEISSPAPVSIKDVQGSLAPDEVVLMYRPAANWLLKDATFLWVIRRDNAELLKLPVNRTAIMRMVSLVRTTLDPSAFDAHLPPAFNAGASHDLYASILAPAAPLLRGVKHLFIVPDGALQSLPFGALVTEKSGPGGGRPQAKWLIRQYAITTLPSVSSLRALRTFAAAGAKAREPFAGFGDPALEGRPGDRKGLKVASLYRGIIADADAVRALDPLPETAGELREMARALGAKGDAIWLRDKATEAQAKKADLSKYRVLAFATHGLMAGQFRDYGEPALVMTPPKVATEADDGLLGASEIAQLKLNADWVILSACNTAAPDGTPGAEGLSGLAKAFFYAGARSLLVSHWPVESESSARLTTGAIAALAKEPGIGRAEALRRSMLALMDDPKYAHPMFWAPFVVVGEGGAGR